MASTGIGQFTNIRLKPGTYLKVPTQDIPVRRIIGPVGGPLDGWNLDCRHVWYGKLHGTLPPYVRCQQCYLEANPPK